MFQRTFKRGDWVVVRRRKYSTHPGRRARDIEAAERGDYYSYVVDKFWVVADVLSNGHLLLTTRRGKRHTIDANDPELRRATFWDVIRYRARFGRLERSESGADL
jgi:hypothetical protein